MPNRAESNQHLYDIRIETYNIINLTLIGIKLLFLFDVNSSCVLFNLSYEYIYFAILIFVHTNFLLDTPDSVVFSILCPLDGSLAKEITKHTLGYVIATLNILLQKTCACVRARAFR